jgi:hypothetical protein
MVTSANAQPAAYPVNGRGLSDDGMDVFLSTITNGKVTRDNVEPYIDLLARFPYLGAPYMARVAERGGGLLSAGGRGAEECGERCG